MESLNILLLAFEYPPYPLAGTGFYAYNLVKSLQGHNVTLITPNHSGNDITEEIEYVDVKRIPMKSLSFLNTFGQQANRSFLDKKTLFALKAKKYIKGLNLKDYTLFHSLNERDGAFLDYTFMNNYFPTLVSVNDYYILGSSLNPLKFEFKSTDLPLRYVHHNIMKRFYIRELRNCSNIIPNCQFVSNLIQKVAQIDPNKIKVIYRGIDNKRFEVAPTENKYTNRKVLFIGPNAERKGLLFLVQAVPLILKRYPDATFVFIGSSSWRYKQKIFDFIKKHNLHDKIRFLEHLPQNQLVPYYQEANVFVMPSIMEALGQVYLEAMTARTPVIGADVGGVSEIITPDVGILVKPQDPRAIAEAIKRIFSHAEKAKTMGEQGYARATRYFSLERQMKDTLELYKSLL